MLQLRPSTAEEINFKKDERTSLVVQCLRLRASEAESSGSIPGQGTGPHVPQLSVLTPPLTHGVVE